MADPMTEADALKTQIDITLARWAVDLAGDKLGDAALHLIDAAVTIIVNAHRLNGADGPLWARHYAHHLIDSVEFHIKQPKQRA